MAFAEDLDVFLADFGVACSKGGLPFTAILDLPDEIAGVGEVGAVTGRHVLTYATADVTLTYNDAITVDGVAYVVHDAQAVDDGRISRAAIGRV